MFNLARHYGEGHCARGSAQKQQHGREGRNFFYLRCKLTTAASMSKKKQPKLKENTPAPYSTPAQPPQSPQDALLKRVFVGSLLLMALLSSLLSLGTGINGDDEYQVDYSEKLVSYYLTMGQDTSALYIEKGNMHYYGGFFDLATGLANHALGFDKFDPAYHHVRHLFNAWMGITAILFMGLLAYLIGGWRAAVLGIWLMYLSPRFFGHAQMNPKDIPFAAGFAMSLYFMVRLFRSLPSPHWKTVLGLAAGIGLALSTRAGGLLLFGYLGLFAGLDFLFRYGWKGLGSHTGLVGKYALWCGVGAAGGYALAVLFWPAALADPLGHPLAALTEFSKLGVKIRLLFEGENVMSDQAAWYYPIAWIVRTVPLYILIGTLGSLLLLPAILKQYDRTAVLLLWFATVFPLAYIIYKDSILHDGWRHLMFIYPSLVVLASLFFVSLESQLSARKNLQYGFYGALALLLLEPAQFIARNPHLSYVYFNPVSGGLKAAFGEYETDYWGIGVKQGLDWLEAEGILQEGSPDTLTLASTFFYPLAWQAKGRFGDAVKVKYVRFNSRYSEDWDYGIFPSRFIRGAHLRSGNWPTSKAVHTVKVNGVPIVAIEKNETRAAFLGQEAVKAGNWAEAIQQFSREVEAHADNEVAWIGLSNAYINTQQYQQALDAANAALKAAPDVESGILYQGLAYLNLGQAGPALEAFDHATRVNDEYYVAYYYKGLIHQQQQRYREAYENAQKAIDSSPRFKPAYQLAAQALQALGDTQNAQRYLDAASRI